MQNANCGKLFRKYNKNIVILSFTHVYVAGSMNCL